MKDRKTTCKKANCDAASINSIKQTLTSESIDTVSQMKRTTEDERVRRDSIAVFHDYFAIRGGGERLALVLSNALRAKLVFGFSTSQTYPEEDFPADRQSLELPRLFRRAGVRVFMLALLFRKRTNIAKNSEIRIYSGVSSLFAAPTVKRHGVDIFYCHTPPRFLYDQKRHFMSRIPLLFRPIVRVLIQIYEREYLRAVSKMDLIVTNSQNTSTRLKKYTGFDSVVVYPPIETERFRWRGQKDYYLSTARLSPLKRVERIVQTFVDLPEKKLVVASDGEQLEFLKKLAKNSSNITFVGRCSDAELVELVGNAIATIYLPIDEDFGMSPVESMAAGKPVVGVAQGGMLETIIDGQTGILLPSEFSNLELAEAINFLSAPASAKLRAHCEKRAKMFEKQRFIDGVRDILACRNIGKML